MKAKNRYSEWYKKVLYTGPKSARNILTNLSPNPTRLTTLLWRPRLAKMGLESPDRNQVARIHHW